MSASPHYTHVLLGGEYLDSYRFQDKRENTYGLALFEVITYLQSRSFVFTTHSNLKRLGY